MSGDVDDPPVRMAELLAALSLGIDLGFSQPMEHVLRQCRIALRLADLVDLDETDRQAVYYAALTGERRAATPTPMSRRGGSVTTSP